MNQIDFPCSSLWNNFFADSGLTSLRVSTDPRRPLHRQQMQRVAVCPDKDYWDKMIAPRLKKILGSPPIKPPPPAKKYAGGDRGD